MLADPRISLPVIRGDLLFPNLPDTKPMFQSIYVFDDYLAFTYNYKIGSDFNGFTSPQQNQANHLLLSVLHLFCVRHFLENSKM